MSQPRQFRWHPAPTRLLLLAAAAALAGCSSLNSNTTAQGAYHDPQYNVYTASPTLPADVKRVALLPLATDGRYAELLEGCEALDPIVNAEVVKTKKFEVVRITPEDLWECTTRWSWTGAEALPPELFSTMHDSYGCDAVLFCELTEFRSSTPLAIGWRMKLVDARSRQVIWAGDEIFDAANGAPAEEGWRRRFLPMGEYDQGTLDNWLLYNAPQRFGRYTVARLLATLPSR